MHVLIGRYESKGLDLRSRLCVSGRMRLIDWTREPERTDPGPLERDPCRAWQLHFEVPQTTRIIDRSLTSSGWIEAGANSYSGFTITPLVPRWFQKPQGPYLAFLQVSTSYCELFRHTADHSAKYISLHISCQLVPQLIPPPSSLHLCSSSILHGRHRC